MTRRREREQHDVSPSAGRRIASRRPREREQSAATPKTIAQRRAGARRATRTTALVDLPSTALERREARAHRVPVVLDPLAEAESRTVPPSRTPSTTSATPLPRRSAPWVTGRELEIRDRLACANRPRPSARSSPASPCRRRADQVEQRRRELERAGLAALAEQRRHERRLGVGRRLLLVLAVVAVRGSRPKSQNTPPSQERRAATPSKERRAPRQRDVSSRPRSGRGRARTRPRPHAPRP